MKHRLITLVLAAAAAGVAGCATNDSPRDYRAGEERVVQSVEYGTVVGVRAVKIGEDSAPVGTIAGAAIGGLLGSQIGHGDGRALGAIVGAVGGGFAGNAIEHKVSEHDGEEISVRLDNGSTIAVTQGGSGSLRPGDRVQVVNGRGGARVERI
jgi:outer membrane lipoprotein SlyB